MIEKMKKLTFLVTQKEYDSFIEGLREQGVVHVQQLKQGQSTKGCVISMLSTTSTSRLARGKKK